MMYLAMLALGWGIGWLSHVLWRRPRRSAMPRIERAAPRCLWTH